MKSRTYTAGANAERDAVKAHVRRLRARMAKLGLERAVDGLDDLLAWLLARHERYNKKSKGVGK